MLGAGEVALRRSLGVEDDVGDLSVLPLMLEGREELPCGALGVEVCEPDGYKGGVPASLVRVELRGCLRTSAHVVAAQDFSRSIGHVGI